MVGNFIMKICTKCNNFKKSTEYHKQKANKDGLQFHCKACDKDYNLNRKRTKDGLISRIYNDQRGNSKQKGNPMPNYTLIELRSWIYSNSSFNKLYKEWVDSNYKKCLVPSCDRINDYKAYTIDNLQLTTWEKNKARGHADIKAGINNKKSKSVLQLDKNGLFVSEHYSIHQAGRATSNSFGNISQCCLGNRNIAGGFRWIFSLGIPISNNTLQV